MGADPYKTGTAQELADEGHVKLREMTDALGTTPMWARRLVRDGRVQHARDENGHIWVPASEVEKYQEEREHRALRGAARKAGAVRQAYVPAPIKALKRAKNEALKSNFSKDDIALYCTMTDEMIAALTADYADTIAEKRAEQDEKAAEALAEAGLELESDEV